jgi:hypothetical protein
MVFPLKRQGVGFSWKAKEECEPSVGWRDLLTNLGIWGACAAGLLGKSSSIQLSTLLGAKPRDFLESRRFPYIAKPMFLLEKMRLKGES